MTASKRFDGRVVVVTGAGSGIGRATALRFAELGAKVHAADVDAAAAAATRAEAESAGRRAADHAVDVADPAAVHALADRVFAEDGRVDVLHNNAGVGHVAPAAETTVEEWQRVVGVNLLGVAYGVQAFVPRLLTQAGGATIVNTASMAGLVPAREMAPYCASKFGVVGLTKALHAELAPQGVHVGAVCPGIIATRITRTSVMHGEAAEKRARIVDFYERRGARPEEVAEAVIDLVRRRLLIRTVPRRQVVPPWVVERLAPRASQHLARAVPRLVLGRR